MKLKMKLKTKEREIPLHIMLMPAVIIVFIYCYLPMIGIVIAFQDFNPAMPFSSPWVGFKNFDYIIHLRGTFQILRNTLVISFFKIVGMIIVPVFYALLLNEITSVKFKKMFQTLIYIPYFLSWVIMAGILIDILSPSEGIVNKFLNMMGVESIFFLGNKFWFPIIVVLSDIWKSFGFGTIVYLAALTNIDPILYEAAIVDGAKRFKQTIYITLPGITPIIILMTVLGLGNIMNAGFEQIFNLYNSSVYETGDIIDTFVYRLGINEAQLSPAAAVGLFKSVVSFIFVSLSYFLADKVAGYRIF